ncbi:hypothetical protein LTS18_007468 [Coniosporium uncinatum]|uniref:Uncharacterized protein n=1 Tax=Coniosporium uncinatum TaxID=93489 RepID=A0ACC3DPE0_9PEZI|nr:hypothetical protein LTS18_007468 [Coniosporium uncinatum]
MQDAEVKADPVTGEVVTIPISAEDELSDIPAEMREIVAAEIAAFRDRSSKRDLERLRREEEAEAAERARNASTRYNRLASPPVSAPSGPAGGANGIPLGPRDRVVPGAPSGPKGFQGAQIPKDYQNGVKFVNGSTNSWVLPDDEDTDASDEELERRRKEKCDAEVERQFLEHERRWVNREKSRAAALERQQLADEQEEKDLLREREIVAKRLKEWDDDVEASRKLEEYYADRSNWLRNRNLFRAEEKRRDDFDRRQEDEEKARVQQERDTARGMADNFLDRQAEELNARAAVAPREPQRFKMSLGAAAAQRTQQQPGPLKRSVAEVEGLLEDEEEQDATRERKLIPIRFDKNDTAMMTEEERQQAARQLAQEIPSDKEGLWEWPVKWEFVTEEVIKSQLKPFVEKKIVEYLGVQEQMLVDVVEEHIGKRSSADTMVQELEGALDEEAEVLVKKLWRMIIFFSESEKRGLSA